MTILHTAVLHKINFFYPVGNTPPVFLTETLAPEEAAQILLLGCGDPRSILFTIYFATFGVAGREIQYDFTCCDLEPAILARNILLFTLIVDDEKGENCSKLWNIVYHLYLDRQSLLLLQKQAEKLVRLSSSLDTWHDSEYGHFLRICNQDTLFKVHCLWGKYAAALTPGAERKFKASLSSLKDRYSVYHTSHLSWLKATARGAGPLYEEAIDHLGYQGMQYWQTGIMDSSQNLAEVILAAHANPTFLHTYMGGEQVMVHYALNPIESFHVAPALASLNQASPSMGNRTQVACVIESCKAQFHSWCAVFRDVICPDHENQNQLHHVDIRFFAGDALAFCEALQLRNQGSEVPAIYTRNWAMTPLVLDSCDYKHGSVTPAPTVFNVIDTSNLTDHLGLLNILLVATPLLFRSPSSVLYTESLIRNEDNEITGLKERLGGDIGMMSVLFDLAPLSHLFRSTTQPSCYNWKLLEYLNKSYPTALFDRLQHYQRLAWKFPSLGDPMCSNTQMATLYEVCPVALSRCLFKMYQTLFQNEGIVQAVKGLSIAAGPTQLAQLMNRQIMIHYTRATFSLLVQFVKQKVQVSWPEVMRRFKASLERDKTLMIGASFYQELRGQLHIMGLDPLPQVSSLKNNLPGWVTLPRIVAVTLIVPRASLNVFDEVGSKLGTPIFQTNIYAPGKANFFCAIQAAFGKLRDNGQEGEELSLFLEEDASGWRGTSPMIVTWYVPFAILQVDPENTFIALQLYPTPIATSTFIPILGQLLQVFGASLYDEQHVFVTRSMPSTILGKHSNTFSRNELPDKTNLPVLSWMKKFNKLENITKKLEGENIKPILSSGQAIKVEQVSPCCVRILSGPCEEIVEFPYPIYARHVQPHCARKSGYLDVNIPIASGYRARGGYATTVTPVTVSNGVIAPWNLGRVNLDAIPAINVDDSSNHRWLQAHVDEMLGSPHHKPSGSVLNETLLAPALFSIMSRCVGIRKSKSAHLPTKVIFLHESMDLQHGLLILVNDVKLDPHSHSILLDACVVINETAFELAFDGLINAQRAYYILDCPTPQMQAWKKLLPAVTERCRTWKHTAPTCEYINSGCIPLSVETGKNPLCTCAVGTMPPERLRLLEWGMTKPGTADKIARHGTRAAISPLFPGLFSLENRNHELHQREAEIERSAASQAEQGSTELRVGCYVCKGLPEGGIPFFCSRCRWVKYCSRECQRKDWPEHKPFCKILSNAQKERT